METSSSQIVDIRSVAATPESIDENLEEKINKMEDEVRRLEVKRKTAPGGRKPKRRTL